MKRTLVCLTAALALAAPVLLRAEKQPAMHEALEHLRRAKAELEHAERDKGGHRAEAIRLIEQAEKQIREGIAHDNRNDEKPRVKKK